MELIKEHILTLLLIIALVVVTGICYFHEDPRIEEAENKITQLENEIDSLYKVNTVIEIEIDSLGNLTKVYSNENDSLHKEITKLRTQVDEDIIYIDSLTSDELTKFFTDRYRHVLRTDSNSDSTRNR